MPMDAFYERSQSVTVKPEPTGMLSVTDIYKIGMISHALSGPIV